MKHGEAWFGNPASDNYLAAIGNVAPAEIAGDLIRFYRKHDGADRAFDDVDFNKDHFDYLTIDSIDALLESRETMAELFPSYRVIGGDGGGHLMAYEMDQPAPWPIVLILPGYTDPPENPPVLLAGNLDELMRRYFSLANR